MLFVLSDLASQQSLAPLLMVTPAILQARHIPHKVGFDHQNISRQYKNNIKVIQKVIEKVIEKVGWAECCVVQFGPSHSMSLDVTTAF